MKVKTKELIKVLESVLPGTSDKEIIDQSNCFIFKKDKIETFNDSVYLSCSFLSEIECAVRVTELYNILQKIKEEEIEISRSENELLLCSGRTKVGLKIEDVWKEREHIEIPKRFHPLPEDFSEALLFCVPSTSTDFSRKELTCVHIKENTVEACDNLRLTRYTMKEKVKEMLLPSSIIESLTKRNPKEYSISEGWVHFNCENDICFSCRIFSENFPEVENIISFEGEKIKLPPGITKTLERVSVLSRKQFKQDEFLIFTFEKGMVKIKGSNDIGWAEEYIRTQYKKDKPFTFLVNTDFIIKACSLSKEIIVGTNKIKIEGENFIHVILLIEE